MKKQLWLTETERDTLDAALRYVAHVSAQPFKTYADESVCEAYRVGTRLMRRRLNELIDRIALPTPTASGNEPEAAAK